MIETTSARAVSPAALRFVREWQSEGTLGSLAELTTQIFPDARHLSVDLHEDPDVADLRWVVIRVEVPWEDAEHARQARDEWYARTAEVVPATALANFGLEIDRRPG